MKKFLLLFFIAGLSLGVCAQTTAKPSMVQDAYDLKLENAIHYVSTDLMLGDQYLLAAGARTVYELIQKDQEKLQSIFAARATAFCQFFHSSRALTYSVKYRGHSNYVSNSKEYAVYPGRGLYWRTGQEKAINVYSISSDSLIENIVEYTYLEMVTVINGKMEPEEMGAAYYNVACFESIACEN